MRSVWGWVSAAVGIAILGLLVAYGTEYGTWVDAAGMLPIPPPTFVIPFAIGGLALILVIGGLVSAFSALAARTRTDP